MNEPRPSTTPAAAEAAAAATERRLQAAASVAGAVIVAFGVLVGGWSALVVLALYWAENVVIGALHVLRLLVVGMRAGKPGGALFVAAFFSVHYGLFTAGHGVFVVALFAPPGGHGDSPFAFLAPLRDALFADRATLLALAALAVSAALDALRWLQSEQSRGVCLDKLMAAPYGRIVVLHVTLIGGGFLMQALQAPAATVLLLVGLKLWFDLRPPGFVRQAQRAAQA